MYVIMLLSLSIIYLTLSQSVAVKTQKLNTNKGPEVKWCKKLEDSCAVNFVKGQKEDTGVQGPPGLDGTIGEKSPKGDAGVQGPPGLNGVDGKKGSKGDMGEKGDKGTNGDTGPSGATGERGVQGATGIPGIRGLPGTCTCPQTTNVIEEEKGNKPDSQLPVIEGETERACRFYETPKFGNSEISPDDSRDRLLVYCNGTSTCIKPSKTALETNNIIFNTSQACLLSSQGFDPRYEIEKEDLMNLQRISTSVTQSITIHCLNTYVYHNGIDERSLAVSFATWNDMTLRSHPTEDNLFYYYTVPEEKDGCRTSGIEKENWKFTEIMLRSDKSERLPIRDVYVKDGRGETQRIRIELGDLCFD